MKWLSPEGGRWGVKGRFHLPGERMWRPSGFHIHCDCRKVDGRSERLVVSPSSRRPRDLIGLLWDMGAFGLMFASYCWLLARFWVGPWVLVAWEIITSGHLTSTNWIKVMSSSRRQNCEVSIICLQGPTSPFFTFTPFMFPSLLGPQVARCNGVLFPTPPL